MDAVWLHLVLAVLATWRVATLLAHDDGPWDVIARLRAALGHGTWGRLLDCFHCVSLWVAAPLAWAVGRSPLEQWLAWPALSGAACLLERSRRPVAHALSFEPWDERGERNELLRHEASDPGDGGSADVTPLHGDTPRQ